MSQGIEAAAILGVSVVAGAVVQQPLVAARLLMALEDFAFFRRRYFGGKVDSRGRNGRLTSC